MTEDEDCDVGEEISEKLSEEILKMVNIYNELIVYTSLLYSLFQYSHENDSIGKLYCLIDAMKEIYDKGEFV